MNKSEKIICILLGTILAWYIFSGAGRSGSQPQPTQSAPAVQQSAPAPVATTPAAVPAAVEPVVPAVPEQTVVLENDKIRLELSTWGGVVKKAVLKEYARDIGEISEDNPPVQLDFAHAPLGAVSGLKGVAANAALEVKESDADHVLFVGENGISRKISIDGDYQIVFEDDFGAAAANPTAISLGVMRMGDSKNDQLSVDSMYIDNGKGKAEVIHHYEGDSPLKSYLVGGYSGGCSGSSSAVGMPASQRVSVPAGQHWIALKNRFFVSALVSSSSVVSGFDAEIARDLKSSVYRPDKIAVQANLAAANGPCKTVFYVGPKQQSRLWDLGLRDVMDFGMWRWLCYPLVWILNLFNSLIPNFGVAIILLTVLVRLIFWPLTHKSTVGMKKMQEIQPLMKDLQTKYKDNPQRLQQEMMMLYREHKVNPLSSCLPMLVQIPVFIALFNVLRSAVELRYAPFLWISDLSEPEGLFASWFPFGGLNILPVLMAVTTGLQSAFTPTGGDRNQQKMMMVFMPLMMLFMFYSFPAALSLYWFLSNLFSIVQMWLIRRSGKKAAEVIHPEVIDPPNMTRQMRRHSGN